MNLRSSNLPLLLLTGLLHFGPISRGQASYIIDTVGLAILPSTTVPSGTPVNIVCKVIVIHDITQNLNHTFQISRHDATIYTFTTKEDTLTYKLNPARAADSGSYQCRVMVKEKSKSSFSQKLVVTGLQTPTLYINNTHPYESEEFTAVCSAPEEKGALIFRIYQRFANGESEIIKQLAPSVNSSETTLVLRPVGDRVLYCDYEINLVSGPRRSNHSKEISLLVKGLQIAPIMNVLPSSNVSEGDVVEVVCKVVSDLKNVEVYLTMDKRILKQAPISLNHRFTATVENSGELVCKAVWGNVKKETYQTITVNELFSRPTLTVKPTDIFEGDIFNFSCSISKYDPQRINKANLKFSYYKDNVIITSSQVYSSRAHPSKNGNYTCKVQAQYLTNSFVKESQIVVLKAKVRISQPVLSVVGGTLVLGKDFQVVCHSDNGSLPITYSLSRPNKPAEIRVVSNPGEQAIFNVTALSKAIDINHMSCQARNSQHEPAMAQTLHYTKLIEPVSKPVLRIVPNMGDVTEGQDVTLVCSVHRGTVPILFTWHHTKEGPIANHTSDKLEASYKITKVRAEQQGAYYCVCTNLASETKQSQRVTIGVKMAGWKKGLIAAFCILLLVALLLVLIFKKHLLWFKKRATNELSVKSAGTKVERLSLTQAEVSEATNVTPGILGKSVWSEHVSGSESDDQHSVTSPEQPEPQYTEVQIRKVNPDRAPVERATDTVYSEVRTSKQAAPEEADGFEGSVEYAELNHDCDQQGDHGDHTVPAEHSVDNNMSDHRECDHDTAPDC
eukprot:XP_011602090.1 PREDICTED: platelet endothelial cell adhesion molecule-like isoform X1 [Takifugu rubripes]